MHEEIRDFGYKNPSDTGLIVKFFESMYIVTKISYPVNHLHRLSECEERATRRERNDYLQ